MSARETLPPPRAVVTAAYLVNGVNGPRVLLEVCPACTAQLPLTERDCLCRAQCPWAGCPWDDPANLEAIARKADAARPAKFKAGDRVRITGKGHPHRGQSGTISAPFSSPGAPDLAWTVSLDNWSEAAVSEQEIRRQP